MSWFQLDISKKIGRFHFKVFSKKQKNSTFPQLFINHKASGRYYSDQLFKLQQFKFHQKITVTKSPLFGDFFCPKPTNTTLLQG